MKRLFFLFAAVIMAVTSFATKPEKELDKLYVGMPLKAVKNMFGEPKYSHFEKTTNVRMLMYNVYKQGSNSTMECRMYFQNDALSYVIQLDDDKEVRRILAGDYAQYNGIDSVLSKNFVVEGKSLVVSKIISGLDLTNEQISDAVSAAIVRACNGTQGEMKMRSPTRIMYHGLIDKVITFDWKWGSINVFYTVDVAIKEGRVRVKVMGEEIDWHQDHEKATYYFSEVFPIGTIRMTAVSDIEAQDMIRNTVRIFSQYISVIEEEVNQTANDNW